jgi:hypothetical protein
MIAHSQIIIDFSDFLVATPRQGNAAQKSLPFTIGHSPGFVLCFALRKAASHCSRVYSLARCSAKTVWRL